MTRDELTALLGRVEQATGPDREIDRILAGYPRYTVGWRSVPAYTASLDAIVGLIEREFPVGDGNWNITTAFAYGSASLIPCDPQSHGIHDKRVGTARAATMPLALCAAFLRAKLANISDIGGEK